MHDSTPIRETQPAQAAALEGLRVCLARLMQGPWRFIQLRGDPVGDHCIDGDDVDLLGSQASVNLLCDAARQWVSERLVHLRVHMKKPGKMEWWLFSIDGQHVVKFDLWIELSQIGRSRSVLQYEDVAHLVAAQDAAILRLPVALEASIYVHHLICKRKDLRGESARSRLKSYEAALRETGEIELAQVTHSIQANAQVTDEAEAMTLARMQSALPQGRTLNHRKRGPIALLEKLRIAWLDAPRLTSMISIMGCDGAGKTTLAHAVKDSLEKPATVFTGKHLYRKSILYKLAVIFIRPLLMRSRESFDEVLAPLVYLRACLGLRFALWFKRNATTITLIDRSLADFLYVNRKTDSPRFSSWRWLTSLFGKRICSVHCLVSFENVMKRKQEMTESGHTAYDRDMFEHHTRRSPTDYIAFNNDGPVDESARALASLLKLMEQSS